MKPTVRQKWLVLLHSGVSPLPTCIFASYEISTNILNPQKVHRDIKLLLDIY